MSVMCVHAKPCLTLRDPVDCSLPGSVHGDSSGKNTEVCCHALLQGIFPTPISYVSCTGHLGSPIGQLHLNLKKKKKKN